MELYILIGLITIVLILQIVFLLKKPKVKILQQIRITKAIFSILKPILPMSFHVVEKKHPKA